MSMTDEVMKFLLRNKTDETDDDVLSAYLEMAGDEILNRMYPFQSIEGKAVPSRYYMVQVDIAAYHLNKRGAEGELNHIENGITRMYEAAATPPSLIRQITPVVGVPKSSTEVSDDSSET